MEFRVPLKTTSAWVLLAALISLAYANHASAPASTHASIDASPLLALHSVPFDVKLTLKAIKDLPQFIGWHVVEELGEGKKAVIGNGTIDVFPGNQTFVAQLEHSLEVKEPIRASTRRAKMRLYLNDSRCAPVEGFPFEKTIFQGWVSLLPPVITLILSIAIGEVLPAWRHLGASPVNG